MWLVGRYGKHNHVCNIWRLSIKGCGCGERRKFAFSHWLHAHCVTVWCKYVITLHFYRASAHWRAILIQQICPSDCLSVCLSVRLSVRNVRPVSDENSLTYRHSFFSPYGSPIILVLPAWNIFTKFRRGHPCGGAKYRWGIKNLRFSTNKSL